MNGLAYVGAALAVCLAALGSGIGQGIATRGAMRHCQATGGQGDIHAR